jgi:hypothetical protein
MKLPPLRVFQLNAAKANPRIHALLNTLTFIDIVLLQEPWYRRIGISRSDSNPNGTDILGGVSNPAWDLLEPSAAGRPGVSVYVRRGIKGLSTMVRPDIINHRNAIVVDFRYGDDRFRLINVYNPDGDGGDIIDTLTSIDLDPGIPTAVSGDFNLHHQEWALHPVRNDRSAGVLLEWALLNSLVLQNEEGVPTRRGHAGQRDSIIDLTFFDHFAAEDAIFSAFQISNDEHFTLGSDHNAIAWAVDFNSDYVPDDSTRSYKIDPDKRDEWCDAFIEFVGHAPTTDLSSPEGIDREVDRLMDAMSAATAKVMPEQRSRAPVRAPWWNEECTADLQRLRDAPRLFRQPIRDKFRRTIQRAKRTWGDTILQGAQPEAVWRLADWTRGKRRKKTPPILGADGIAIEADDKARAFAATFFPDRHAHVDPIQPDDPPPRERRRHHRLSVDEMRSALRDTSNTSAPGGSGSNYRLLKWAINMMEERFLALYDACLTAGYHPRRWRLAIIAIILKPRKTDLLNCRSYRPISLLECMGKLLEKVVATRCQTHIWEGSVSDQISRRQQRTQAPMEANQDASQRSAGTGFAKVAGFKNLEQGCRALCPLSTSLHHHGNAGDGHPAYLLRARLYDDARPRTQHPRG